MLQDVTHYSVRCDLVTHQPVEYTTLDEALAELHQLQRLYPELPVQLVKIIVVAYYAPLGRGL